jgi:hypothetical protein
MTPDHGIATVNCRLGFGKTTSCGYECTRSCTVNPEHQLTEEQLAQKLPLPGGASQTETPQEQAGEQSAQNTKFLLVPLDRIPV